MADTIRLSDGTTTHDLYAGTAPGFLLLASGLKFGLPEHENLYHSSEWQDGEQLARHKLENRVWSVKLALKSGNSDDAIANQLIKLNRTVRQARRYWLEGDVEKVYLEIILSGSTTYTRYDCLDIEYVNTDIFSYFNRGSGDVKFEGAVELKITTTSYGYGAEVTLANSLGTPHFEEDGDSDGLADQWNESAGTETTSLDTTTYLLGSQSQEVITNTTSSHGIYSDTVTVSGADDIASYAWLFCTSGSDEVTLDVQADSTGSIGTATYSAATETDTGANSNTWKRLDVIGSTTASDTTLTMRVERLSGGASKATTFYIDKTYLQLDATAIPDGWMSCRNIENHYDTDEGDINYIDVASIPGDLEALTKVSLVPSHAMGTIYVSQRYAHPIYKRVFEINDWGGRLGSWVVVDPDTTASGNTSIRTDGVLYLGANPSTTSNFYTITDELRGKYKALFRCRQNVTADSFDTTFTFSMRSGAAAMNKKSLLKTVANTTSDWIIEDFGIVSLPIWAVDTADPLQILMKLEVERAAGGSGNLYCDYMELLSIDTNTCIFSGATDASSTVRIENTKENQQTYAVNPAATQTHGLERLGVPPPLEPDVLNRLTFVKTRDATDNDHHIADTFAATVVYSPCTEFLLGTE